MKEWTRAHYETEEQRRQRQIHETECQIAEYENRIRGLKETLSRLTSR